MKLPHLDPNFVLWCNLISDVVTTFASAGACWIAAKLYLADLRRHATNFVKKL